MEKQGIEAGACQRQRPTGLFTTQFEDQRQATEQ